MRVQSGLRSGILPERGEVYQAREYNHDELASLPDLRIDVPMIFMTNRPATGVKCAAGADL
jgi:hypothetical protein